MEGAREGGENGIGEAMALGWRRSYRRLPAGGRCIGTAGGMEGFRVLTSKNDAMRAENMVVLEYTGPVVAPMAENLRKIWIETAKTPRFNKVLLRLNSPGGSDVHGRDVIAVLSEMRSRIDLVTLVGEEDVCASMCVAVFIQGDKRYASPASSWMFHGVSVLANGSPSLSRTAGYFDLFAARQIDRRFIAFLYANNYVTSPGAYRLSGAALAAESNIINDLTPNWRPRCAVSDTSGLVRGGI